MRRSMFIFLISNLDIREVNIKWYILKFFKMIYKVEFKIKFLVFIRFVYFYGKSFFFYLCYIIKYVLLVFI